MPDSVRSHEIALVRRTLDNVEKQWPDMADAYLHVPLEAYSSETVAAHERALDRGKVSCTVYPRGPQTRWAGGTVKLASKLKRRKSSVFDAFPRRAARTHRA